MATLKKAHKWVIISLAMALVILAVFLCGLLFERTLGPLPTFALLVAVYAIGCKWAGMPKGILSRWVKLPEENDGGTDEQPPGEDR